MPELTPPVYVTKDNASTVSSTIAFIFLIIIFVIFFVMVYCTISCAISAKKKTNNKGVFMRALIKSILIVAIALFALVNYRLLSFSNGFSRFELNDSNAEEAIMALISIDKIEYYDTPLPNNQPYIVSVETAENNYLFRTDDDGIAALSVTGVFAKNLKPQKITPVPFWIEIIVALVIIFIPFGRRKKETDETIPTTEPTNNTNATAIIVTKNNNSVAPDTMPKNNTVPKSAQRSLNENLTSDERQIIGEYRQLSRSKQDLIKSNIEAMLPAKTENTQGKDL